MGKITAGSVPKINAAIASRVLEVVDAGLSEGVGNAIPGEMCVEAAVCYAMGEPHTDKPRCVLPAIRNFKIALNDSPIWDEAGQQADGGLDQAKVSKVRAKALRRIAIAQLGSKGTVTVKQWRQALIAAVWPLFEAKDEYEDELKSYTERAKANKREAAEFAKAANKALAKGEHFSRNLNLNYARKPDINAHQGCLGDDDYFFSQLGVTTIPQALKACELAVQVLIKLKTPGSKYLYLTERKKKTPAKKAKRHTKTLAKRKK